MKFTSAALVLLATAPSSTAFTPSHFSSTRIDAIRKNSRTTAFLRRPQNDSSSDSNDKWTLRSTIERKNVEVAANNASLSPTEIADLMGVSTKTSQKPAQYNAAAAAEATRAKAVAYLSQYANESGAAIVYSKLQENGVTVVNGYSGGAVLPLLDQFHEHNPRHENSKPPIRWITNSNEQSAGHVAEGYAKAMPVNPDELPVGVAIATSGPGVTNLITPLQDAMCDGVPMVVLCGQAATTAPEDAFQSCPAVQITTPCTKWSYQIKSAAEIPFVMDYAFYVARNGRPGPVFVDLPKDLQNQILGQDQIESFVETSLADTADESSFAHLVSRRRPSGEYFQGIHLGHADKGLTFELSKASEELKLNAVSSFHDTDSYHADHHPTNKVFKLENSVNGDVKTAALEGDLQPDSPIVSELGDLIKQAKKPIIIAGQGCNDCPDELKAFAEMTQIPVTTTLHALGCFDERHDLALNMMGMHGHPTPNFMVQEADLVINVGSRFDDRITGRIGDFVPEARKAAEEGRGGVVHVDIRLSEQGKQVEPTFFVHSTGKNFLQTMNEAMSGKGSSPTKAWLKHMKALQQEFPVKIAKYPKEDVTVEDAEGKMTTVTRTRMTAQSVITEMNAQLLAADKMDEAIFSTGVGIHQMVSAQLITWTKPRQMLSSGSLGVMGVALGYAIGAKLANGGKIVIAVDGDGSFNMTFTELKSVAEQKIPVKIMILDNESQMMVEYWQRLFHKGRYLAVRNERNPEYTKLADAFGIKNLYCDCEEDLPEKMKEFLFSDPDEPVLFHVRIERTPCLPLVAPGEALQNMILEDVDFEVDASAAPS